VVRLAAFGIALALTVGACAISRPLPTVEVFNGACRGVGLDGHVTGDPFDPRLAWVIHDDGGGRIDVIWPPGYTARFTPRLEVLDEQGAVAYRDGDPVSGGCTTGPDAQGPLLIAPGS
jgi:hypothetical protein